MRDDAKARKQQVSEAVQSNQGTVELNNTKAKRNKGKIASPVSELNVTTSIDSDNDCVFLFDSELNCIEISKAALQLFPGGTRKKDIIGKHLLDISPGLKETGRYNRYVEVLKTGIPISEAINIPGPRFADVSLSTHIYRANDGLGIAVNFAEDIGELGQVGKEIREAEERYRGLVEGTNDIVYVLDDKAVVTYISPVIESIVGYSVSEIVGRNISEYIYPEDLLLVIERFQTGSFANIPGPFEFRLLTKSGEVRWVRNMARTLFRKNRLIGYQGILNDITDSKRAEEDIKQNEQHFRAIIENTSDIIVILNPDATIRYESPSMERITGRKVKDRIGENPFDYCHPDDIGTVTNEFIKLLENKIPRVNMEIRLQNKDGRWLTFEVSGTNLIDDPAVAGIVLNLRDISERKQAENEIRKSEGKYRTLVETMNDGLSVMDKDFILTYVNKKLCEMTGYSRDEIIGHSALKLMGEANVDDANRDIFRKEMRKRRKGGGTSYEMEIPRKDGSKLIVNVSPQLITDVEGNIEGSFGIITDITERKQMEENLWQNEEQYRTLVETMSDGLAVQNRDGIHIYVNDRFCDMTGYSRAELLEHSPLGLMDEANQDIYNREMIKRGKGEKIPYEMELMRKNGSRLVVHISPQIITDKEGNTAGAFGVITDITKAREAEEALRKSERDLRLAQELAHLGYWEWDISTNEVVLSEEMQRILGYYEVEAKFSGRPKIVHPADIVKLQQAIIEKQKGGSPQVEFRLTLPTGDTRWIQAGAISVDIETNEEEKIFGYALDITERKQAEEELKYSEQKIRNLFESVSDGLCVIDLNGIYTEVNNKLLEMQGFSSKEEVLGKNAFDFVAPRDIDRARVGIQRYLEQGSIELQEYTNVRTDGSEYPVEITSTLLKDVSGNPTGFIASVRDITERKRAEEALRESQEKLRTVFDSIGDGITVLDLAGNIVDVNDTVLRIKGYDREDVIGRFGLDFVAEKDHTRATEGMMVLFSGEVEQTPAMEYALIAKDGSEIPCEASASLLRDGAGNVIGLISVERDIRERKKAERSLQESEEQYRMIVEIFPHGIQENDTSGLITFSNKAHHEISGYAEGELKGKYIWDLLVTNHEKEELQAYFANLVSEQPLPVPYFTRNCTKDGRIVDVQVDWNYRYDAQGQLVGFVSIITDITERKHAEQQLQESEDLLKQAEKLAGIGSWQWNLHNNTFVLSEGMRLLYGTEGKGFTHFKDIVETLVHPDDREEVYKAAERVVDKGSGKTLTYRVIRPDGEVRWMNATIPGVRRFGKDGKPEIMVGAVQDITERKQDEQQLREREERWKLFSESATDIFTIWDSKLNLIDNSEKGIQTFLAPGTRKDDLIGKNMMEFIPDEEKTGRYYDYLNVIKTGKPYFSEHFVPHHKFGDRQVSLKAFKVGEGLGTIVTDITEQRHAEHHLQESEERLRAFMDSSTDIYCIFDSQLRLVDVSDKGVKTFLPDKSKEEQIGKHIAEIVPEVMETGRYEEYLKVIETGEPFQVEEVIIHPRFARRHISIKAFKVQDGMGMIFTDITERKKAEDELLLYSERLRDMTKQLSGLEESERRQIARELHDNVGQNLTVLGINFSRAKTQMTEGKIEEVQSILDDSQGLVEQTTAAIRDIMANLRPPVLEDYGLLAALRWHGDRFASRTGIAISVQGEEPDPRLGMDLEIVLFRIAQEALMNIAKHAKANHVTVKYNAGDGKAHLVITDDGIGFNVADLSASAKHLGWGMVTMSERAQSIGGSLRVESRPGGGTQIVVEVVR